MKKMMHAWLLIVALVFGADLRAQTPAGGENTAKLIKSMDRGTDRSPLWQRSGNIISGFCNMYQFCVVPDPEDKAWPYKAFFFGWAADDTNQRFPGCDAIFMARGTQLDKGWQVYAGADQWDNAMNPKTWAPVVAAQDKYYDQWHNGDPSVVKKGGLFYLAYSSTGHNKDGKMFGAPGDTDGSFQCIMGAISKDGIHWQRARAPIMQNTNDYGEATDPRGDSQPYGSYARPCLMFDEGKFKLWWDYWTPTGLSLGYAENKGDFLNPKDWRLIRGLNYPAMSDIPNFDAVKVGGLYFGYADPGGYDSHPWKGRKITEYVSLNGIDWLPVGHVEPDKDTPAFHVPQALLRREGSDTWIHVFHACQIGGGDGRMETYNYRYDRIRYMKRKVGADEIKFYTDFLESAARGLRGE